MEVSCCGMKVPAKEQASSSCETKVPEKEETPSCCGTKAPAKEQASSGCGLKPAAPSMSKDSCSSTEIEQGSDPSILSGKYADVDFNEWVGKCARSERVLRRVCY